MTSGKSPNLSELLLPHIWKSDVHAYCQGLGEDCPGLHVVPCNPLPSGLFPELGSMLRPPAPTGEPEMWSHPLRKNQQLESADLGAMLAAGVRAEDRAGF